MILFFPKPPAVLPSRSLRTHHILPLCSSRRRWWLTFQCALLLSLRRATWLEPEPSSSLVNKQSKPCPAHTAPSPTQVLWGQTNECPLEMSTCWGKMTAEREHWGSKYFQESSSQGLWENNGRIKVRRPMLCPSPVFCKSKQTAWPSSQVCSPWARWIVTYGAFKQSLLLIHFNISDA